MTPITRVWRADRHHSRPRNQGEDRAAPAEQVVPADLLCSFLTTGGSVGPAVMETVRQILAAPGDGREGVTGMMMPVLRGLRVTSPARSVGKGPGHLTGPPRD